MSGSGKSTIGMLLAERIGFKFIDLDELIKNKEGKSHAAVLEEDGEEKLLQLEEVHTLNLDCTQTVFSPGGSIIYSPRAMEKLRNETTVVYVNMPLEEIKQHVKNDFEHRGIVGLKEKGIDRLFMERAPIYENVAHHIINCGGLPKERIVDEIVRFI